MLTDRVVRLNPKTGQVTEYLLPGETNIRGVFVDNSTKPATFWAFQRGSIMRRVEGARRGSGRTPRTWRVAAAAVLAFFLGGAVVYETVKPVPVRREVPAIQAHLEGTPELTIDPWQNDELKDFHAVVEWESWVPENKGKKL